MNKFNISLQVITFRAVLIAMTNIGCHLDCFFILLFLILFLICVCARTQVPLEGRGAGSPRAGATDVCEPTDVDALEEQYMLLNRAIFPTQLTAFESTKI